MKQRIVLVLWLLVLPLFVQAHLIDSQKLLTVAEYGRFSLSPDGDNVTYIQRGKNSYLIINYNVKDRTAKPIKNIHVSNALLDKYWVSDDVLLFEVTGKKANHTFLAKRTQDGFKEIRLDRKWSVVRGFPSNGKHILISERKKRQKYQISLVEIESLFSQVKPKVRNLFSTSYGHNQLFYESSIQQLIGFKEKDTELLVSSRALDDPNWSLLLTAQADQKNYFLPIGFLDSKNMVVLSNKDSDKVSVYAYSLVENKIGDLIYGNDKYDVIGADIENGEVVSVSYLRHGKPHHEYLNKQKAVFKSRLSKELEGLSLTTLAIDRSGENHLLFASSPTHAGSWYHFDSGSDVLTRLISAYENLEEYELARTQLIEATTKDGIRLEGLLTTPRVNDRKVLIVMPHGGPVGVQDSNVYRPEIQLLANRGFTVLRVNFRGSAGYGKAFQNLGIGALGGDIEADILTVLDKVNERFSFTKTCAMGSSYGGYSSVMLAIHEPERFDCVVAAYGIYDIPYLFSSSNFHGKEEMIKRIEGAVGAKADAQEKPSPVYLAEQLNVPILLIAGRRDYIAHFEHSHRLKQVLEIHNKEVETLFFKHVGHGQASWYRQRQESLSVIDFLERVLKLEPLKPSSDIEKALLANESLELAALYDNEDVILAPNYNLAVKFNERAAQYDNTDALYNLGKFHQQGLGRVKDFIKAKGYYERAALKGHRDAKVALAKLYFHGTGIEKDTVKAHEVLASITEISEHQEESLLRLMLYCQTPLNEKQAQRCLTYPVDFLKKFESPAMSTLARLIVSEDTPSDIKASLMDLIVQKYHIDTLDFTLKVRGMGTYVWSRHIGYSWRDKLVPIDQAHYIPNEPKQCYLEAFVDLDGVDTGKRAAAIIRWEVFNKGKLEEDGFTIFRGKTTKAWRYKVDMDNPGLTYQVSVFNLRGEQVQSFKCENV
ncbi:alpha/beta fold hydrolase [Pseudoalteromonas sp. Of7M-16]|uniref:alpha/beta fold hydrolase n=1 Tax=Pseudoalteromonas sp. Of7M-16 TaxID=2917756 RepID=UPI001EF5B5B6|nr:alpha/beta fold hydrolase [Pseudoalteromonas sp. Of7M-16]MCG7548171.1 alpha/beta fold hydrolase [Pseudoalteromonas sp. Of7M-16]